MKDQTFLLRKYTFPEISEIWFRENGITDPKEAYQAYQAWMKARGNPDQESIVRKIQMLGSGLTKATISNYHHKNLLRFKKVGEESRRILDSITISLGYEPPNWPKRDIKPKRKIALLAEMENIPSRYYHLETIKGVIRSATAHKYAVTLHEISADSLLKIIKQIILAYRPDGIIILRIAPDEKAIQYLKHERIPTVLISGDDKKYPPPIVSNLVSVYPNKLKASFRKWVQQLKQLNTVHHGDLLQKVIFVRMPIKDSHRGDRNQFILQTLKEEGIEPEIAEVPSYSFHEALKVWQNHPNALAYICLSDQIAVALKHFCIASGLPWENKIIGFDNSSLAIKEGINSFGAAIADIRTQAFLILKEAIEQGQSGFSKTEMEIDFFWRANGKGACTFTRDLYH